MDKIFIIGNRGMFGTYFTFFLKKKKIKFYTSYSYKNKRIDFAKKKHLFEVLNKAKPKIIINLAGLTSIELCEKNMKLAKKIGTKYPWLAWVPVADYVLMSMMAGMHWWPAKDC
jgi:dTDP-4-dehydrorhamnose reductase